MSQSAHRETSLWRYERPTKGHDGLHLRARYHETRLALHDRLVALQPCEPHLFKFGAKEAVSFSDLHRKREVYVSAIGAFGAATPHQMDGHTIRPSIPDGSRTDLLSLLTSVAPDEEDSVAVEADGRATCLFVWWDVEWRG